MQAILYILWAISSSPAVTIWNQFEKKTWVLQLRANCSITFSFLFMESSIKASTAVKYPHFGALQTTAEQQL